MAEYKGTSNIPMIVGILGGMLCMPPSSCTNAFASAIGALGGGWQDLAKELGPFYYFALTGTIATCSGFVGGLLGKKIPKIGGIIMIIATFMSAITLINFKIPVLIATILFLIGTIFCFIQKEEEVSG